MSPYIKLIKGATKIKIAPPKEKYTVPLLNAIDNETDFIDIINELSDRINSNKQQWSIIFKSLIVIHMIIQENPILSLNYLNENTKFFNNLHSNIFNKKNKWAVSDLNALKKYSDYLEFRSNEWDIIRNFNSNSNSNDLLEYVQSLERQVLKLLKNKYSQLDLNTDLFSFTFKLLVKDLLLLYNKLNEGVIKLLESFFDLSYKDAEITLALYKRFVDVTEAVVNYLRVAKAIGLNIPVIKHITTRLIRSLEDHLNNKSNYNELIPQKINKDHEETNQRRVSEIAQKKKLDEVQDERRQLQQQIHNQQLLMSPATLNSTNPFSPQVDSFSFEPTANTFQSNTTGNPFMMQQPVQAAYTNGGLLNTSSPTGYNTYNEMPVPQQQQQSLAPARTTSMMINNPFGADVSANMGMGMGMMTDTTTGITYMPVPVQIAAINPFQTEQTGNTAQSNNFKRQSDSLVDL